MVQSSPSRIVNVASGASQLWMADLRLDDINSEKKYSPFGAYCQSKVANVLFTRELSSRLSGTGVTTYSLHPGTIKTEIGRHVNIVMQYMVMFFTPFFFKNPRQGAQTTIYCAV